MSYEDTSQLTVIAMVTIVCSHMHSPFSILYTGHSLSLCHRNYLENQ